MVRTRPVEVTLRYWKKDGAPNGRRTAAEPMVLGTGTLHADAPQQMNLRLPGAGQGR